MTPSQQSPRHWSAPRLNKIKERNKRDKDYIVPAIWMCHPRPNRLWDYIVLLSESEIPEVKEFFASPEFRSILDGEFAEVFFDKSLEKENELKAFKK